ncbi:MAG: peptidylprolyl isomerase [Candidatus Liberibacter europaeus]|uniref:Peptidylprolyl isomerase n=1 Tax=Candidatus Liberibacter europaeus TaxID=744859 RepID=A0A2T4VXR1_9HYPH|nr:peptidylprolyl isomerase [Candidatus Liberibacter europaeus]PTL86560.1 MAG: peptidylprolyl isomerase [Candidatus Liberibacter europaeus]
MLSKENITSKIVVLLISFLCIFSILFVTHSSWAISSQIYIIVNEDAITDNDISRRIALLNLQKITGDLHKIAAQELITDTLKKQEIKKHGMSLSTDIINYLFELKAHDVGLSVEELKDMLEHQGVGEKYFKELIELQQLWNELILIKSRLKFNSNNFEAELPYKTKMVEKNTKIKEYILRTITFVTPYNRHNDNDFIQKRIEEAEDSRSKFPIDCNLAEEFASKMRDVSVGMYQRFLETDLSPKLHALIKKTKTNTTDVYVADSDVVYTAICHKRDAGDEISVLSKFQNEKDHKMIEEYNDEYIKNLRLHANIRFHK